LAEQEKDEAAIQQLKKEILERENQFTAVSLDYMSMKPSYFNTGCCCFSDGDITGIEIAEGCIRLIKWSRINGNPTRHLLEEMELHQLITLL